MPKPRRVANPKPHSERIGIGRPKKDHTRLNLRIDASAYAFFKLPENEGLARRTLEAAYLEATKR